MPNTLHKKHRSFGFTLIELLIVVTIVGILGGIVISSLNVTEQRRRGQDGVKLALMEKLALGLEAYYAIEGTYPPIQGGQTNPMTSPGVSTYISAWPDDTPEGAVYTYSVEDSGQSAGVVTELFSSSGGFYKYRSEWGNVRPCENGAVTSTTC